MSWCWSNNSSSIYGKFPPVAVSNPTVNREGDPLSEFYLTGLSQKDKPWDHHRALADEVRDLYNSSEFADYADRIAVCAKMLEFALTTVDSGEQVFKLQTTWFCRVRHCPVCQWRRSLMWKARFIKALPSIATDYPTARWIFLTLTVQNCPLPELRSNLNHMNQAWIRLTKRKIFPALGWVKSFEVTRSKNGTAHPHFHILMMVPPSYFKKAYISQEKWRELWQHALRANYEPRVDVRAVKDRSIQTGKSDPGTGLLVAIKETLKYTVKGNDLVADASWLLELTHQLHKTRAIALGGVLKNYLSEEEPDQGDLIHGDEEEGDVSPDDPRWWFSWREMVKRYMGQVKEDSED